MENRTEKKTVSTVDMTTEVFKAMSQGITSVRNVPERNEKGRRCGSRMLTRKNTDSALQRSKTTNRAAALPETVTRGRRTAAG